MGRQLISIARRLIERSVVVDGCWLWTGALRGGGYGTVWVRGKMVPVHRAAYEEWVGPIPHGLTLDHLCRNRVCIKPTHLEPVNIRENILRGTGPTARNAVKTHCVNGHEFTSANTRVFIPRGAKAPKRACLKCERVRHTQLDARRKRAHALTAQADDNPSSIDPPGVMDEGVGDG